MENSLSGWLVLDKPLAMTSAQAVGIAKKKLSKITGKKIKIGHTGTLDPLATGILPLALGEATKLSQFFLDSVKSYDFTISWGEKTDTADTEGKIIETSDYIPSEQEIYSVIPKFIGDIVQIPSKFSALKINGKRAYDLARNNIEFDMKERFIHIYSLKLLSHNPDLKQSSFSVECSKGTYIRTLAEDIALACNTYGHLLTLRRTKVGFFSLNHAILPDICENMLYKAIIEISKPLNGISAIQIKESQEKALRYGQSLIWENSVPDLSIFPAFNDNKVLVSLVSFNEGLIIPKRVFNL
jgi:tRNA pseudouridine55 synthase